MKQFLETPQQLAKNADKLGILLQKVLQISKQFSLTKSVIGKLLVTE